MTRFSVVRGMEVHNRDVGQALPVKEADSLSQYVAG